MIANGDKPWTFQSAAFSAFVRGFTMIELLVVISIISMLMSILMPSLKKAREQGRTVVCQTNLRQLMFAWNMYAMDNGDHLCSASVHLNGPRPWLHEAAPLFLPNHWVSEGEGVAYNPVIGTEQALADGALWDYLEVPEVYKCHSHRTDYGLSYAVNHTMAANLRFGSESIFTTAGDFTTPADRLVFIDSIGILLKEDLNASYPEIYDLELHGFYPIEMDTQQWNSGTRLITRHNGGTNLAFADGHTDYYRWKDFRTTWYNDGRAAVPQAGSEADNFDFEYLFRICKGSGAQLNSP